MLLFLQQYCRCSRFSVLANAGAAAGIKSPKIVSAYHRRRRTILVHIVLIVVVLAVVRMVAKDWVAAIAQDYSTAPQQQLFRAWYVIVTL